MIVATRPSDGWLLGAWEDVESAKEWVELEHPRLDPYEPDYWEVAVGEGGARLK